MGKSSFKARRLRYGRRGTSWRSKRQQRLEIDGHKCRTCGHDGSIWQLTVHHVSYEHWGDEPMADLITLCAACHWAIEESKRLPGRNVRWGMVLREFEEIPVLKTLLPGECA